MIVVFIIAGVVALISLYDYFNSRSWQQVTSTVRNDAVFKNRNREYGAFAIRRDYDKRLMLIVGGLIAGLGVLYAATKNDEFHAKINKPKVTVEQWILEPNKDEKPDVEQKQEQATESNPQPLAKMLAFREPQPSDNPGDVPDVPEDGKPLGGQNNPDGPDDGGDHPPLPKGPDGGPDDGDGDGNQPPVEIPDEPAQFPGGHTEMLKFLRDKIVYPQVPAELGIQGKCFIKFVVSKKGDISDVRVMRGVEDCPECDKEAVRVIKSMPLWRPGRVKGKAVDSYFNLPVKFALQ
ncbi:MAG TPA: TonB family protein [Fluviicola sp.]|nr:TonB family protein [Fluviicola sp.]